MTPRSSPSTPCEDAAYALSVAMSRGQAQAVEAFYREHFPTMLLHARRLTRRDEHFCLDVVQDATLRIVRSIRPIRTDAQLRRYVRSVVRSAAIDLLRKEKRRAAHETRTAFSDVAYDHDSQRLEELEQMHARLARLQPEQRRLLVDRIVGGVSFVDLGKRLGVVPSAVHARINRLLVRLRGGENTGDHGSDRSNHAPRQ